MIPFSAVVLFALTAVSGVVLVLYCIFRGVRP